MSVDNIKKSLNGYRMELTLKDVPIPFVNGLRRIVLSELPVVVVRDIQILENTSQLIHEMITHRISMLPVNVHPNDTNTVRDAKLELRYPVPVDGEVKVTTANFNVSGLKKDILLRDRDLNTELPILTLKAGEKLHIRANLGIEQRGSSHVCVSTFKNKIDVERAKLDKDTYVLSKNGDPRVFDNHEIQRSFIQNENGRPTQFDFTIESVGVIQAKELLEMALKSLKERIVEWCQKDIMKLGDNRYSLESQENHTVLALAQSMIYSGGLADWVSYTSEHPLLPNWTLTFTTKLEPEAVIKRFKDDALALCDKILAAV
jgi:DNA-directed RNA polymerase alpha subunit